MNKYKQALLETREVIGANHYRALQELVERSTPKKSINKEVILGGVIDKCEICGYVQYHKQSNFCHYCGQALDWSDSK